MRADCKCQVRKEKREDDIVPKAAYAVGIWKLLANGKSTRPGVQGTELAWGRFPGWRCDLLSADGKG